MSGLKYSKIELEREMKAQQKALNKITILTASILELKEKTKKLLNELSQGLKESFPEEIKKVIGFQETYLLKLVKEANSTTLNKSAQELQLIKNKGLQALHLLIEVKDVHREKKARELTEQEETLHSELSAMEKPFIKWRREEYEGLNNLLTNISPLVDSGDFIKAENLLYQIEQKIVQLNTEVSILEEQDRQRYYTLSALTEVCKEMGWDEKEEPHLETPNNPEAAIIYRIKSYSAGDITFRLSLQEINVDSPISKDKCFKEFDTLSDKLKRFGVHTKFEKIEQPDDLPELKQRGELDLPDSVQEIELGR